MARPRKPVAGWQRSRARGRGGWEEGSEEPRGTIITEVGVNQADWPFKAALLAKAWEK